MEKTEIVKNYSKREAKEYTWWRSLLHYISIFWILIPYFKIFYNAKVEGMENIPKNESFIVAANHLSTLDPVIVSMSVRKPIAFMAKKQLFESPKLRKIIDMYGAFSVNREKLEISTIRTAQAVLSTKKWILAVFPQGSRETSGIISKVTPGFAYLSKLTKAKILPVAIMGSDLHNPKPFEGNLIVKIGKPIEPSDNMEEMMNNWISSIIELTGFEDQITQK